MKLLDSKLVPLFICVVLPAASAAADDTEHGYCRENYPTYAPVCLEQGRCCGKSASSCTGRPECWTYDLCYGDDCTWEATGTGGYFAFFSPWVSQVGHRRLMSSVGFSSGFLMSAIGACCCLCACCAFCQLYKYRAFFVDKQRLLLDDDKDLEQDILLPADAQAPSYWENQDLFGEEFDEFYSVDQMLQPTVQQMFNLTWKDIVTRDRKGGAKPEWLEVTSVQRFEDQDMYASYYREKERISRSRGDMKPIRMLDGDWSKGKVLTDDFNAILAGGEGLDQSVNEHFLFHGTSPEAAANIAENGFRINLAGSNAGTLFGKGAYLAECSSKADEYATTGHGPMKKLGRFGHQEDDEYAILICRVVMGKVLRCFRSGDKPMIEKMLKTGQIDSVLGDREEAVGTYREFIVYREAQIYPEYRVLYKRRNDALE